MKAEKELYDQVEQTSDHNEKIDEPEPESAEEELELNADRQADDTSQLIQPPRSNIFKLCNSE